MKLPIFGEAFNLGFELSVGNFPQETDGDLVAESEEVTYECGARHKYPLMFEEPVALQSGRWYVAWARVSGPSSDCGSSGQTQVSRYLQSACNFICKEQGGAIEPF